MKKVIRLTESDLHQIIINSVSRLLKEDEARNGKGTGVDKMSDAELVKAYKLEKKFLKDDFTDEEVYKFGFTPSERKKFDKAYASQQDKMIEKRTKQIAKLRYKKYRELLIQRGLIKPKANTEQSDTSVVPNKNAVVGTFTAATARKMKRTHTPEDVQLAQQLLPSLMKKAQELYAKYGTYDVAKRFNEIFTNINLALYEYTGTEYDNLPQSPQNNNQHPTSQEAEQDIENFRKNDVFETWKKLKTPHLKNCLASCSHAETEIGKVLSGEEATNFDTHKAHLGKQMNAKREAGEVERKRLKINGVENDLL